MQELRLHLAKTRHARAQVSTLRDLFLKLGAQGGGLGASASCCTYPSPFRISMAFTISPCAWALKPVEFSHCFHPKLTLVTLLAGVSRCASKSNFEPS